MKPWCAYFKGEFPFGMVKSEKTRWIVLQIITRDDKLLSCSMRPLMVTENLTHFEKEFSLQERIL